MPSRSFSFEVWSSLAKRGDRVRRRVRPRRGARLLAHRWLSAHQFRGASGSRCREISESAAGRCGAARGWEGLSYRQAAGWRPWRRLCLRRSSAAIL